jgi:hypothetical protein
MAELTPKQEAALERVIALARQSGGLHIENLPDRSRAYAYFDYRVGIGWAVTDEATGDCVTQGIRP